MNATATDIMNSQLRTALERIASANRGVLNPHRVVEAARDPANILHHEFEWDDTKAAEGYRLAQAGILIRRVKLHILRSATQTREAQLTTTRAFQSRPTMRTQRGGYESIDDILKDEVKRLELLAQVLHEIGAYRRRYAELVELQPLWVVVDELTIEHEETSAAAPAVDAPSPGAAV